MKDDKSEEIKEILLGVKSNKNELFLILLEKALA